MEMICVHKPREHDKGEKEFVTVLVPYNKDILEWTIVHKGNLLKTYWPLLEMMKFEFLFCIKHIWEFYSKTSVAVKIYKISYWNFFK